MSSKRSSASDAAPAPERASRARQRQRLIDACISALHIHGPSRTTVEKVVAIAEMSPGIVRFYFDSKDAMLVASLAYLAAEFETRVMTPVAALRHTPVRALEQLVELYLDAEIASPRKVSVWYSFWGEASSRQEYYELCGKKDDAFAALVRELIERVIEQTGESHLDPDAIALGLIGVLEVLWQGIAFTEEANIDRAADKRRSIAYLRSIFPRQFGTGAAVLPAPHVPGWAYADGMLFSLERESLFRPAWQLVGHESDVPHAGDFLTVDLAAERALLIRDDTGVLRALRNSCRKRPHRLVGAPRGHFAAVIQCEIHGLVYGLDGRLRKGITPGDLAPLEIGQANGFVFVRSFGDTAPPLPQSDWGVSAKLNPAGSEQIEVACDWKLLVEQWLEAPPDRERRRLFLPPNQLLEISAEGLSCLQVIPETSGKSRIRRLDYDIVTGKSRRRAANTGLPKRLLPWLQQDIDVAESTQTGLAGGSGAADDSGPVCADLAEFRRSVAALLPGLEASRRGN